MKSRWFAAPRAYLLLVALVLLFRIATAIPIERPGYMDASYTLHVAKNLAQGRGFTEEVLWNYLDAPSALPHPSNLYWMPLPAILTAASFVIFGVSYHAAQIPFILLSLLPPLFAFYLTRRLFGRDDYAWMAGLLTAFSGFYTVYWIAPDNFTPFAVTTCLALLFISFSLVKPGREVVGLFIAGLLAGLSQLSRADGFLLLLVVPLVWLLTRRTPVQAARAFVITAFGFLVVLSPWLVRNYVVSGSVLAPGGASTLFLTNYDEFFRYQASDLTLGRYLEWGLGNILGSKISALGFDALVVVFGAMQIFLAPFAVIGLWRHRNQTELQPLLIYLPLLLIVMAFVFTFPSTHGSMLHSSAALVPYLASAVPSGLDALISWIARRRRQWNEQAAQSFFRWGFAGFAFCLSIFLFSQGVLGSAFGKPTIPLWNDRDLEYEAVAGALDNLRVPSTQPVLTVDPPSFIGQTRRPSIITPTDSLEALFQVAHRFDAHYLVLQFDHPRPLNELYDGKGQIDGLGEIARFQDAAGRPVTLYRIEANR